MNVKLDARSAARREGATGAPADSSAEMTRPVVRLDPDVQKNAADNFRLALQAPRGPRIPSTSLRDDAPHRSLSSPSTFGSEALLVVLAGFDGAATRSSASQQPAVEPGSERAGAVAFKEARTSAAAAAGPASSLAETQIAGSDDRISLSTDIPRARSDLAAPPDATATEDAIARWRKSATNNQSGTQLKAGEPFSRGGVESIVNRSRRLSFPACSQKARDESVMPASGAASEARMAVDDSSFALTADRMPRSGERSDGQCAPLQIQTDAGTVVLRASRLASGAETAKSSSNDVARAKVELRSFLDVASNGEPPFRNLRGHGAVSSEAPLAAGDPISASSDAQRKTQQTPAGAISSPSICRDEAATKGQERTAIGIAPLAAEQTAIAPELAHAVGQVLAGVDRASVEAVGRDATVSRSATTAEIISTYSWNRTIAVELSSQGLGTVRVSLRMRVGAAHLEIEVARPESARAIEACRDDLKSIFEQGGLIPADIVIAVRRLETPSLGSRAGVAWSAGRDPGSGAEHDPPSEDGISQFGNGDGDVRSDVIRGRAARSGPRRRGLVF